ncbi:MAG: N-acetyltransferase [Angelakisella sp.]
MSVRAATLEDLNDILKIYGSARRYMAASGNPTQWGDSYPGEALLTEDIQNDRCFVCLRHQKIHGVFVLMIGAEPTYGVIEQGAWKTSEPYGTIHRIASDGTEKGVFLQCLEFCKQQIPTLRADTHHDNKTMQHLLEKNGFLRCGIITVEDGTPRIAYEYAAA